MEVSVHVLSNPHQWPLLLLEQSPSGVSVHSTDCLPPLGLLPLWPAPNSPTYYTEWFLLYSTCLTVPFPSGVLWPFQSSGLSVPTEPFKYHSKDRTYSLSFVSLTFKAAQTNVSGWTYFKALTEADRKLPARQLYLPHKFVSLTKHSNALGAEIWADWSKGLKHYERDEGVAADRRVCTTPQSSRDKCFLEELCNCPAAPHPAGFAKAVRNFRECWHVSAKAQWWC